MDENIQYISIDKKVSLENELKELKEKRIPDIAKRIDEAKQMGDLSENAEYHQAREDMSWAQSHVNEISYILDNAVVIAGVTGSKIIQVGVTFTVKINGVEKQFTIVGPQEANPQQGKISNESPLGQAFISHKEGDKVEVKVPAGLQIYKIVEIK